MNDVIKKLYNSYAESMNLFYSNETDNNKRKMNKSAEKLRIECEKNDLSFLKVCDELSEHILKIN